jgi:hypothetical protein
MRILGLHIVFMWRPHSKETSRAFDSRGNEIGNSIALYKGDTRRSDGNLGNVEVQDDLISIYNGAGFRFKPVEAWERFRERNSDGLLRHKILDGS